MTYPCRRPVRSCVAILVVLLSTAATPCFAEWRRLDSPNFVVVGDAGAGALRDIAVKFEGFRETLSRVLTNRVTSTAVPTIVIVFDSDKAFTPFKPKYEGKAIELAGLFLGRPDVNYIALTTSGGAAPAGRRRAFLADFLIQQGRQQEAAERLAKALSAGAACSGALALAPCAGDNRASPHASTRPIERANACATLRRATDLSRPCNR
jgi:hypothetical protein